MRAELSKDEEPPCGRKLGRLPVGIEPGTSPAGKVMEYSIPFQTLLPCVFFALLFFVSPVFSRLLAAISRYERRGDFSIESGSG